MFIASIASLLLVAVPYSAAITPTSCYWCVSQNMTWDYLTSQCSQTGYTFTKPENCTSVLDLKNINGVFSVKYDGGANTTFDGKSIVGRVDIPYNGNDSARDLVFSVFNMQSMLDLQMRINCDKTQSVAYQMISNDIWTDLWNIKMSTAPFTCGSKVEVKSRHLSYIVVIQNSGRS